MLQQEQWEQGHTLAVQLYHDLLSSVFTLLDVDGQGTVDPSVLSVLADAECAHWSEQHNTMTIASLPKQPDGRVALEAFVKGYGAANDDLQQQQQIGLAFRVMASRVATNNTEERALAAEARALEEKLRQVELRRALQEGIDKRDAEIVKRDEQLLQVQSDADEQVRLCSLSGEEASVEFQRSAADCKQQVQDAQQEAARCEADCEAHAEAQKRAEAAAADSAERASEAEAARGEYKKRMHAAEVESDMCSQMMHAAQQESELWKLRAESAETEAMRYVPSCKVLAES